MRTPGGTECETVNETAMKDERAKDADRKRGKSIPLHSENGKENGKIKRKEEGKSLHF